MEKKEVTAKLKGLRSTPRKVGLIADLIRGVEVNEALRRLSFSPKRASHSIRKLLESAVSNAKDMGTSEDLIVSEVLVGKGPTLKRGRAGSRGSYRKILKMSSNIKVTLTPKRENASTHSKKAEDSNNNGSES